jgi:hypothetical protein
LDATEEKGAVLANAMLARLNAYRDNPDPRAAAANTLALLLASNGPTYPIYVYLLVGPRFWPVLVELWTFPLLILVPWLARRNSLAGRVALVVLSTLNTTIFVLLLGPRAGLQLFFLPCIALGVFFHHRERYLAMALAGIPLILFVWLRHYHGVPLRVYTPAQYESLRTMNEISVACLTWFLMVLFSGMTTALADAARRDAQPAPRAQAA